MPKSNYQHIQDFQLAAGAAHCTVPTVPDVALLRFRHQLIREEYAEVSTAVATLAAAIEQGETADLTPLAHEMADLLYVVYGTFAALGIDADAVFAEVHRANMEKIGGPRRADGKLLKPPGWQPANVRGVIDRLQL